MKGILGRIFSRKNTTNHAPVIQDEDIGAGKRVRSEFYAKSSKTVSQEHVRSIHERLQSLSEQADNLHEVGAKHLGDVAKQILDDLASVIRDDITARCGENAFSRSKAIHAISKVNPDLNNGCYQVLTKVLNGQNWAFADGSGSLALQELNSNVPSELRFIEMHVPVSEAFEGFTHDEAGEELTNKFSLDEDREGHNAPVTFGLLWRGAQSHTMKTEFHLPMAEVTNISKARKPGGVQKQISKISADAEKLDIGEL